MTPERDRASVRKTAITGGGGGGNQEIRIGGVGAFVVMQNNRELGWKWAFLRLRALGSRNIAESERASALFLFSSRNTEVKVDLLSRLHLRRSDL